MTQPEDNLLHFKSVCVFFPFISLLHA